MKTGMIQQYGANKFECHNTFETLNPTDLAGVLKPCYHSSARTRHKIKVLFGKIHNDNL